MNPSRPVCLLVLLTMGCFVAACQQAPGLHREMGTYSEWMPGTPAQVTAAANQAVREMNMHVISASQTQVVARTSYGSRVTITARPDGPEATRVGVKVEPGEGEEISRLLLDRIRNNLTPA